MRQWSFSVKYSTRPKNAKQVTASQEVTTYQLPETPGGPGFKSVSDKIYFCELSLGWICVCDGVFGEIEFELICWKIWVIFWGDTLLNKSSWIIWIVLKRTDIWQHVLPLSLLKLCPPAQPVPPHDWSSLSVGLVDVWLPSMGFLSSHDVSVPPGPTVVVVCRQLEWVVCLFPPDSFSTCHVEPHMLT